MTTLLRELIKPAPFDRIPEPDLVMDSAEAVAAFARAGQPNGILSGVYAFYVEQASRMIRPGDRVLDLGCGSALLLASVAKLNEDASFVGIDSSAPMIATGNESLSRSGARNVALRIDDMTELATVESGSVDVVLSSMSMHHLADTDHLQRCFEAIDRVMAPNGRVFISDFGRLKSVKSVEYFVRRAIPKDEPRLEHDYRASLRAAFSTDEFMNAMSAGMKQRVSLYATVLSPMMIVLMTPFPDGNENVNQIVETLPRKRRADYHQLRLSFRLGGMPCT
ncbi:MAG TPA: class I SAM-dependent methyltransferase [Pyrinomonadaceae bacterium]|nr:class I SAM-dependent methyltransferase [Pyrinomonadaceae bacterium]